MARIARSHCRLCGQLGHWKAECPSKNQLSDSSKAASANVATVNEAVNSQQHAFTAAEALIEATEVFSEPEDEAPIIDEDGLPDASCIKITEVFPFDSQALHDLCDVSFSSVCEEAFVVRELFDKSHHHQLTDRISNFRLNNIHKFSNQTHVCPGNQESFTSCAMPRQKTMPLMADHPALRVFRQWKNSECLPYECLTASCEKPCHAILDTGASRCIIGEKVLQQLRKHLPPEIDSQVKQVPSSVTFRFGNNQSSSYRIQIPLLRHDNTPRKLWLAIEVVPGSTPFLFSKKAFKQLGGILDTTKDQCILQRLNRVFSLDHSKTDLYLLDISKLCSPENQSSEIFQAIHVGNDKTSWGNKDVAVREEHDNIAPKSQGRMLKFPEVHSQNPFNVRQFASSRGKCVSDSSHFVPSFRNASKSDADKFEERVRVHDRTFDFASSDFGTSTGVSAIPRGQRGTTQCRGHSNDEQHAPGVAEPETGAAESRCQSNESKCRKTHGTPIGSINSGPKSTGNDTKPYPDRSIECKSDSPEYHPGPSSSARSSFANTRQSKSLNLDSGRGRGGVRGIDSSGDFSHSSSTKQHSSLSSTTIGTGVIGRLGKCPDYLGKKTQGQDLPRSLPHGHRLLPLVIAQSAGLRALLSSSSGTGSPELSGLEGSCPSSLPQKAFDPSFSQEVQCVREQLSNSPIPERSSDEISQACDVAEGLIEQVFLSAKPSHPKSRITLLEIYAGPQSPLVEAVRSLGFKAIRFTKADGDLSTVSGRRKLWEIIDRLQPENIWVAPECRPWGGWARLNLIQKCQVV